MCCEYNITKVLEYTGSLEKRIKILEDEAVKPKKKSISNRVEYRAFILTMPNNNSWNGKWTGDGDLHSIVRGYWKRQSDLLKNVDKEKNHYYNFGDGWGANVEIRKINSKEKSIYLKKTCGFSGYSWMLDEIEKYGRIRDKGERYGKNEIKDTLEF